MPRDGLQQYAPPPGTNGITNYTIESTKYNGFVADVTQDLNLPRPIVAGGTGANNAHDAMIALSGEITKQNVDNYDSFPFVAGSFWSNNATSSPVAGQAFAGICYVYGDPSYMVLEARNLTDATNPGKLWVRQKTAGVWSAWAQQAGSTADLDAAYVNVAGDTMTGALTIGPAAGPAVLNLNSVAGAQAAVNFLSANATKWQLGKQTDDSIFLYDIAGAAYVFNSASGGTSVTFGKNTFVNGSITAGVNGATGTYFFGNSGTKYLNYDGTNFNLVGGGFTVSGNCGFTGVITVAGDLTTYRVGAVTTGYHFFGNTGTKYLGFDGTGFTFVGAGLTVPSLISTSTSVVSGYGGATGTYYFGNTGTKYLNYDGTNFNLAGGPLTVPSGGESEFAGTFRTTGYRCRTGVSGAYGSNYFNMNYTGPVALYIDVSNLGNITLTSDYRIKKDVIDLPGMWDTVKALRPIKYTQADFSPPSHIDFVAASKAEGKEVSDGPMFVADDKERWGFVAHELQETLIEDAATGTKDSYDHVQSPNTMTVVAALTKALQEAMARIEALEATR